MSEAYHLVALGQAAPGMVLSHELLDLNGLVLLAKGPGPTWQMPERRFFADWHERDWGLITEQDYENLANVQRGMRSRACTGLWLNPRQEGNILQMHRVIDRYLTA